MVVGADAELGGRDTRLDCGRASRIYDGAAAVVCRMFPPIAGRLFLQNADPGGRLGCDGGVAEDLWRCGWRYFTQPPAGKLKTISLRACFSGGP